MSALLSDQRFTLRPMLEADLPAVLLIEQAVHLSPWNQSLFANCLASGNLAVVVEWDADQSPADQLVGYAVLSVGGGEAELLNIAVAKEYQGRGVAKHIINFFVEQLDGKADTIFLEVRESNHAAQALYDGLGFNQVGVRPNYYPAKSGREDAFIYALTLFASS